MPNVFAAVYHPPTLDDLATSDATKRMTRMKVAIQQAHGALSTYASFMGATNPFYIFVAPEYYFVKNSAGAGNNEVWTLHTADEKRTIFEELRALSGRYKRFLLAPGTVSWCQPRKVAQGARTHDGWNTAAIFYEGKLKHEYDKIMDDGVFARTTANVLFQKGQKSQLFTVESLRFGIEICGDFNEGNLRSEARPESLDFEIMLSATNRHSFDEASIAKVPIRNGGYFIHSDSDNANFCGAWCVQRGSGSHGTFVPSRLMNATLFDPWTGRMIGGDNLGQRLASGSVLVVKAVTPQQNGSFEQRSDLRTGGAPPVPAAPLPGMARARAGSLPLPAKPSAMQQTQFRLSLEANPVTPFLDSASGNYHVEAKATLFKAGGAGGLPNQPITFRAGNGTVRNTTQFTDGQGVAKAVFTGQKNNQPLQISASFSGATVMYETKIDSLGGGNVSRLGRLQPETVLNLWSYYLPG